MSSTQLRAYRPLGNNKTVSVTASTSNQVLAVPDSPLGTRALRIAVIGTDNVFIEFGTATTVAAVTTSLPMLANSAEVFTFPNDVTHVAIVSAGTGSTVYVTYGEGM